jgi:hypothetical protein
MSLSLTVKALMRQRQPLLDELQSECERLGVARTSWGKQEEIAEWMKEHKIEQDEKGWHFTKEDAKTRDQVIANYRNSIEKLQAQIKEYDDAILTALHKWQS